MLAVTLLAGAGAWGGYHYWMRLGEGRVWRAEFWRWTLKGAAFPWLIWSLANFGFGDRFPALMPRIFEAQMAKTPWIEIWVAASIYGAILIVSWWAAVTCIWLIGEMASRTEHRAEFAFNAAFFGAFSSAAAAAFAWGGGPNASGAAVIIAAIPVIHFTMDLAEAPPPRPVYDRAIAHLKFGKYSQAELEVISQLEKCEDDFDGWLFLAELYAKHFRNLEDAARVVLDLCCDPRTQPVQISIACHKLADWQLEIAENAEAARAALELLCRKLPETHFDCMARQRMKQIPRTSEEFIEAKVPKRIRLPVLSEAASARQIESKSAAVTEANRLSETLTEDPNDIPAREKLADVLAARLGKIEDGIEQLRLLIDLPEPGDEQKARWTAQIAAWRHSKDHDDLKFIASLRELVRDYPQTSQAFAAQRRIFLYETGMAPA